MKIILTLFTLGVVSGQVLIGDEWREVKSQFDSPRYHEIMKGLFPTMISGRLSRGGRIAGGEFAKLGQFVHQALLLNTDSLGDNYICGGSIISHNWILTAAHCLEDIVQTSIYVGIIDRINGPAIWGITTNDKSNLIKHESYSAANVVNDIGLVRLMTTIKNDPNVGIISLPSRSEVSTLLEGKLATIAGFGRYTDSTGPSQQLRWVQNTIVSNSVCEKTYGKANVRATNLCLEGTGGRSSCQGDSGGGLHLQLNGRNVLVGIVSFGAAAGCTLNYPAVYTKVTSYLDWIQEKTAIKIN